LGPLGAPPDEDAARAVEHHGADARPIGQVFEAGHDSSLSVGRRTEAGSTGGVKPRGSTLASQLAFGLLTTALIRTSRKPRASALLAHFAIRALGRGSGAGMPTGIPPSRASPSRRASARSISFGVGTVSSTTLALAKGRLLAPAIWPARLRGEELSSRYIRPRLATSRNTG